MLDNYFGCWGFELWVWMFNLYSVQLRLDTTLDVILVSLCHKTVTPPTFDQTSRATDTMWQKFLNKRSSLHWLHRQQPVAQWDKNKNFHFPIDWPETPRDGGDSQVQPQSSWVTKLPSDLKIEITNIFFINTHIYRNRTVEMKWWRYSISTLCQSWLVTKG